MKYNIYLLYLEIVLDKRIVSTGDKAEVALSKQES